MRSTQRKRKASPIIPKDNVVQFPSQPETVQKWIGYPTHVPATACQALKIKTDHLQRFGIHYGDLVLVDKTLKPHPESLCVFNSNGERIVEQFFQFEKGYDLVGVVAAVQRIMEDSWR